MVTVYCEDNSLHVQGAPAPTRVSHQALQVPLRLAGIIKPHPDLLKQRPITGLQRPPIARQSQETFVHRCVSIDDARYSSGLPVWRASYEAFGRAHVSTDPDGSTVTPDPQIPFNIRFPGQYYDAESGLHDNRFRTYDPGTGRYISADPIGLRGGINTYGYVGANPLRWIDRYGLAIGDYPPPPPGYNPNTWTQGQWPNGKYWLQDPEGNKFTVHPEDEGHWRHWDKRDPDNNDQGQCPPNSGKPRDNQEKLKPNQSPVDPNGDAPPWAPRQSLPDAPIIPIIPVDPIPIPIFPEIPIIEPIPVLVP